MVGFYLPIDDWRPNVIEFNRLSDNNSLRLFSSEIKKGLTKANYREAYFQAVSNSSWAHEGYLVAVGMLQDDEFLAELERLASSFGIGIIQLEPSDIDGSRTLYPARGRPTLDWETINKLCEQNRDFDKFLQDVKIDYESKRIHRAEFDDVSKDITKYIKDKMKIEQGGGASRSAAEGRFPATIQSDKGSACLDFFVGFGRGGCVTKTVNWLEIVNNARKLHQLSRKSRIVNWSVNSFISRKKEAGNATNY